MNALSERRTGEPFDDYFVRLFEDKDRYGLTCQDIADLLNAEGGVDFGESKWRKEYAAFARGMRYAREKTMRGIKKPGSKTVTYAARGVFEENKELCDRFFQLAR